MEFWGRPSEQEIQDLRRDETGVKITQFTGFGGWGWQGAICNPKAEDRNHTKFVEEVKSSCAVAKALNIPMMTIICGNEVPDVSLEAMHNSVIKGLKRAAPVCEDQNVMMICEPMNTRVDHRGHCFYGSEHPVKICREVDSPMCKLNWDVYHMQIMEGDLCRRLREGWDQVGYVQIADNWTERTRNGGNCILAGLSGAESLGLQQTRWGRSQPKRPRNRSRHQAGRKRQLVRLRQSRFKRA